MLYIFKNTIDSKNNSIVHMVSILTFKCNNYNLNLGRPQNIKLKIFKGFYTKLEREILLIIFVIM